MKIELVGLTEENLKQCLALKVSEEQAQYISSNEDSIKTAKEEGDIAHPFAICADGKVVGFTVFVLDEEYEDPNDRYWLWKFMIDESLQGKGYGTAALQEVIRYFKEHGANNIRLSTKETNVGALSVYRKAGFKDTGEMNDEEIVLQFDLTEEKKTEEFFITSDGIKLHAKLDRPEGAARCPLCILIHGFTGHMEEEHIIAAQKAMNEAGVAVLRVEMFGHGKSEGEFLKHTLYKWVGNAMDVVKYAKSLDFVTDLYLSGHSQGGLLTMLVGGMFPDDFKAILPLSPAWMIPEGAREGDMLGLKFDPKHIPDQIGYDQWILSGDYLRVAQTIHVEDEIARFENPVLIVHGDADQIVPYSCAEKAQKLYKNAKLVPIHGDDHCFTKHLDQMAAAIREFFTGGSK